MNSNLLKLAFDLKSFNTSFKNKKFRIVNLGNVFNSNFLFLNFFITDKRFLESPYRNILINTFRKVESFSPGSSYHISDLVSKKILGNYHKEKNKKTEKKLDTVFDYLSSLTDETSFKIFKEIIEFSGPDASITCQSYKNNEVLIEKKTKPNIKINIHEEFIPIYFNNVKKHTKDIILSIIDGFIERESDLIPLIEKAGQEKMPLLVICRGFSFDAIRNIKNILLRNKIVLYPYVSKFNDSDPFLLKDIADLVESKIISADSCDSIYSDTINKCVYSNVTISSNNIVFNNANTNNILSDINNQIKTEKERNNTDVLNYLLKRKKRVFPNEVTVSFPIKNIREMNEIKGLIRHYNNSAAFGIEYNEVEKFPKNISKIINDYSESLYLNLKSLGYTIKLGNNNE